MPAPKEEKARHSALSLRITPELGDLIDQAAELAGKNRRDFVLDAARHAAEDALKEQTVFLVEPEAYATFVALLDAPPSPNDRLRHSLQGAAPWEK